MSDQDNGTESEKLLNEFFSLFEEKKRCNDDDDGVQMEKAAVPPPLSTKVTTEKSDLIDMTLRCLNGGNNPNDSDLSSSASLLENDENTNITTKGESIFSDEIKIAHHEKNAPDVRKHAGSGESSPPSKKNYITTQEFDKKFQYIQHQIGILGGGGETKFLKLDDFDDSSLGTNRHLEYNPYTKKVFFTDNLRDDDYTTSIEENHVSVINLPQETPIGPIEQLSFSTSHAHQEERIPGTLCWDQDDQTLNLTHPGDVTQQIGQELYAYVRNNTGNEITNGTLVGFAGAEQNGTARLEVAPYLGDGSLSSLYVLGVATQNLEDGSDGRVTVWGKVRDINTTGNDVQETWMVGDILYASPSNVGKFTKIKPTAPNAVIPVAAVLSVDSLNGEIFVRPTIEQQESYGEFAVESDINVSSVNQEQIIAFDTVVVSNGVTIEGSPAASQITVNQSGLYQIDISAQIDETQAGHQGGTMTMWIKKNGVAVPNSARRQGATGNAPAVCLSFNIPVSMNAGDYIEIAYASTTVNMKFEYISGIGGIPNSASVLVGVTQVQL